MQIQINNLTKIYDNKIILNNLNAYIENVKVVGIIGESGCGKSTLLRQLSGIELPDEGSISINGTKINKNNLKEYQSKIGVVFQKHNLFPHLTVEQNIKLILSQIKKYNDESTLVICNKILNEFHLTEQANKTPDKISGGQAQRASIARALATNPELIFLDEPTASLDPLLTKEVLESIKHLKKKGIEFIFVTHEMDFLRKFADYFIFMDKGQIVEQGLIDKLEHCETQKLKKFIER